MDLVRCHRAHNLGLIAIPDAEGSIGDASIAGIHPKALPFTQGLEQCPPRQPCLCLMFCRRRWPGDAASLHFLMAYMYHIFNTVLLLAITVVITGCPYVNTIMRNRRIDKAVTVALATNDSPEVKAWHEFFDRWPNAQQQDGYSWHEKEQRYEGGVDASALIEERYVIKINLDFQVSADLKQVVFTELQLNCYEVKEVVMPADRQLTNGGFTILMEDDQHWFGIKEWRTFVKSGWNLSAIGINIISNKPVPFLRDVPRL